MKAATEADRSGDREKPKKKRVLLIIVCIIAAVVLISGGILTAATLIRQASFAVRYDGSGIDGETAAYLSCYAKRLYLQQLAEQGLDLSDEAALLARRAEDGETYAEKLAAYTRSYIAGLLVGAGLTDRAGGLTAAQTAAVEQSLSDVLTYRGEGDERAYDRAVFAMGFDFAAVRRAFLLQYKASLARAKLYGDDGSGMTAEPVFLDRLLARYAHVRLCYIPAAETERVEEVRAAMRGDDGKSISPEMFAIFLRDYNASGVSPSDGFYFYEESAFTAAYLEANPAVVSTACAMPVGGYAEAPAVLNDGSEAVCFLYRCAVTEEAYAVYENLESSLSDFLLLASTLRCAELIEALADDVEFTDKYDPAALAALPIDDFYFYCVRF